MFDSEARRPGHVRISPWTWLGRLAPARALGFAAFDRGNNSATSTPSAVARTRRLRIVAFRRAFSTKKTVTGAHPAFSASCSWRQPRAAAGPPTPVGRHRPTVSSLPHFEVIAPELSPCVSCDTPNFPSTSSDRVGLVQNLPTLDPSRPCDEARALTQRLPRVSPILIADHGHLCQGLSISRQRSGHAL